MHDFNIRINVRSLKCNVLINAAVLISYYYNFKQKRQIVIISTNDSGLSDNEFAKKNNIRGMFIIHYTSGKR